jgi:adenosylcobyric acid synthase
VPGSKSTVHDLGWLRAQGFDHVLALRARREQPVLGICGGCQMLGRVIRDEHGVESSEREVMGLGLLPLATEFRLDKRTERVRARGAAGTFLADVEHELDGYYIHAGQSRREAGEPLFVVQSSAGTSEDGARAGAVLGTMVHGLFEDESLRLSALAALRARRGLPALAARARTSRMTAYDRVADALAAHTDIAAIERLVGL